MESIMENIFGIIAIPSIVVICYLFGECIKLSKLPNKAIPVLCGALGAVLGIVAMFVVPDYPATDFLMAAAVGIVSGFAATGVNQAIQKFKTKTEGDK